MTAIATWFRQDLARRWKSLLVLALLVGVDTGTVMTAVAGARRGASAGDRLLAGTLPVWRYVAESTPVLYLPPLAGLVLVVPAALLATNVLAAWPARWTASMRISQVLRAE